jgi:WD40 repeat protein
VLKDVADTGITKTTLQTEDSGITGTHLYMSPELLSGKPASTRSDIYSLGVVLYQLLVGDCKRPVPTDWADDISDPLLRDDLRHCLAGKPEDRFAAAGLLAKNLRALPRRRTELERRAAKEAALERAAYRRGILRTAAIAAIVLGIIAALAWQVRLNAAAKIRQATQIRSATVRLVVANGLSPLSQGDWLSAGLWFAEAFVLDEAFQNRQVADANRQTHRLRINSLLHQSPQLEQMWFDEGGFYGGGFMPGGQEILLGDEKGFRIFSVNSGHAVSPLFGTGDDLARVSPDGRRIVTGRSPEGAYQHSTPPVLFDSTVRMWDATSGAGLPHLRAPGTDEPFRGSCYDLQFSTDSRWIVGAINDTNGRAIIWDAETGRVERELLYRQSPNVGSNTDDLLAARFDGSGELLVTTGKDRRAVIWRWRIGEALHVLSGHRSWVYSACFGQRQTNWLLTCSFDRTARLWNVTTGQQILRVEHEGDGIEVEMFSPDDSVFVTAGLDSTLRFWDSETGRFLPPLLRSHYRFGKVQWSADGRRLAAITWDGVARVWRLPSGTPDVQLRSTDWSLDGRFALSHNSSGMLLRDFAPGGRTAVQQFPFTNVSAWCLAGGPNHFMSFSTSLPPASASGSAPNITSCQLQLWEFFENKAAGPPLKYDGSWWHLVCGPEGRQIALFSGDKEPVGTSTTNNVLVWHPANLARTNMLTFPQEGVVAVAFDPNGSRMVVASRLIHGIGGMVRLIDLDEPGEPVVLLRSPQPIVHLTFSTDGQWLAAACSDNTLDPANAFVWRVPARGVPFGQASVLRHRDGVLCAAFSNSGEALPRAARIRPASCGAARAESGSLRCGRFVVTGRFSPVLSAQAAGGWQPPPERRKPSRLESGAARSVCGTLLITNLSAHRSLSPN